MCNERLVVLKTYASNQCNQTSHIYQGLGNVTTVVFACPASMYCPFFCKEHLDLPLGSHSPLLHTMCFCGTNTTLLVLWQFRWSWPAQLSFATVIDLEMGINTDWKGDWIDDISQTNETKFCIFVRKTWARGALFPLIASCKGGELRPCLEDTKTENGEWDQVSMKGLGICSQMFPLLLFTSWLIMNSGNLSSSLVSRGE